MTATTANIPDTPATPTLQEAMAILQADRADRERACAAALPDFLAQFDCDIVPDQVSIGGGLSRAVLKIVARSS